MVPKIRQQIPAPLRYDPAMLIIPAYLVAALMLSLLFAFYEIGSFLHG
jgi:hypothetical protein